MQKKYFPLTLVLVILLALLAIMGSKSFAKTAPAIGFAQEKEVYLTFDDGPSTVVTNRILDALRDENVKATFFIVGDRIAGREETLKRAAAEGHTLGVHSVSHDYKKIYASDEALLKDAEECARLIEAVTKTKPHVYRFPGGGSAARERQTKLLEARGFRVVPWNAVCGDEEIPHADAATLYAQTVKTSAGKGEVVLLLHDSAPHKQTAEALPRIIAYFRENGYTFKQF